MGETHHFTSAGDNVVESEIDQAIATLGAMKLADKSCEVHAASTILMLRINKQLLRGQLNAAQGISTLKGVVELHGERITKVEARAFEAEQPVNTVLKRAGSMSASALWPLAVIAVCAVVVVVCVRYF